MQESIAEMLKILDTLKDPQRFWCWLYTITLNKLRGHYRRRWRHKETPLSDVQQDWLQAKEQDVLAEMVARELKQIVVRAVGELEPRQRAVLAMRCYDQMSYGQISRAMGCTQLGARALFHRAKKSMAKLLNSHGIDKTALPVALLIFGKLSATSEAAAAGVSITASTLHVGPWAVLAAAVARHAMLATVAGRGGRRDRRSSRRELGLWTDAPQAAVAMVEVDADAGGLAGDLVLVLLSSRLDRHGDDPHRRPGHHLQPVAPEGAGELLPPGRHDHDPQSSPVLAGPGGLASADGLAGVAELPAGPGRLELRPGLRGPEFARDAGGRGEGPRRIGCGR